MSSSISPAWFRLFPGPKIPDVLVYMRDTWSTLLQISPSAISFEKDEPTLTDNLCEALSDEDRRYVWGMDCDFQAETWELRRSPDGNVTRIARADIRVILGAPGTPHLVLEFKKLDGSASSKWKYCFDGLNRFVDGKYAVGHQYGVMCAFSPLDLIKEADDLAKYIKNGDYPKKLNCIPAPNGDITVSPSAMGGQVQFDTNHLRLLQTPSLPIVILHTLLPCPIF